jgi:hypothetical protein
MVLGCPWGVEKHRRTITTKYKHTARRPTHMNLNDKLRCVSFQFKGQRQILRLKKNIDECSHERVQKTSRVSTNVRGGFNKPH